MGIADQKKNCIKTIIDIFFAIFGNFFGIEKFHKTLGNQYLYIDKDEW